MQWLENTPESCALESRRASSALPQPASSRSKEILALLLLLPTPAPPPLLQAPGALCALRWRRACLKSFGGTWWRSTLVSGAARWHRQVASLGGIHAIQLPHQRPFPSLSLCKADQWAALPAAVRVDGARVFDLFATWRMDSGVYEEMVRGSVLL